MCVFDGRVLIKCPNTTGKSNAVNRLMPETMENSTFERLIGGSSTIIRLSLGVLAIWKTSTDSLQAIHNGIK